MQHLPLDCLRSFVAVADTGGFTAAGERVGRSQPAVSLQIKRLEDSLNTPLIHREGHKIRLSAAGQLLYQHSVILLAQNDLALQELSQQDLSGALCFGMPSEFATTLLPKVLGQFSQSYPNVALEVVCQLSRNLSSPNNNHQFDCRLLLTHNADDELSDELVWVGSSRSRIVANKPIALVVAPDGCMYRERALHVLQQGGLASRVVYTNPDLAGLQAAIEEGLGITVLAKSVVPAGLSILNTHPALPPLGRIGIRLSHEPHSGEAATMLTTYVRASLLQML